ncbi:hypothetical protein [Streptomyces sp. CB03234]|uniref:hypothetical protein n=1 Tax=Streptomyces sp. (strain CB03234) TaxID=1703937 RepID=UPI00117FE1C5|nr:hypothetical protein [Streptomyces sp. CB03234]
MSNDAPVDPAEVPEFTGDPVVLDAKVKALSGAGVKISTAAGDVHTSFGGLRSFYKAPEAEQLFATTRPVQDKALEIASDLSVIAGALVRTRTTSARWWQGWSNCATMPRTSAPRSPTTTSGARTAT